LKKKAIKLTERGMTNLVLMVYNTLTRRKEEFISLKEGEVRMYVCGPTVYDYIHIGNARSFVAFDVIRRYLEYKGYKVVYLSNITDIDDKTIRRARELGISVQQLGEKFADAYFEDIKRLGVKKPTFSPRATQHIGEIINLIEKLIRKGYAYTVNGDVYFDVSKFERYGMLSGNRMEALRLGARIEVDPRKKNPADFALWKSQKNGEPAWDSPWGRGRPGWHIECSAMSIAYLGETFDIHGGGKDLIFPHHENEIAQSEAATGKQFVRYWLHNEWLTINGEKMSKSLGNFITTREALERYGPQVIRMFLITSHYRSPVDFNERALEQAGRNLERIREAVRRFRNLREVDKGDEDEDALIKELDELQSSFEEAMDDDFNTPLALAIVFEMVRALNSYTDRHQKVSEKTKELALGVFRSLVEGVLGVSLEVEEENQLGSLVPNLVKILLEIRESFRRNKEWKRADEVRSRLQELGFVIEDGKEGTKWRWEPKT